MAKSLCCPPETITTLLISYTPIQNKKFKEKKSSPPAILSKWALPPTMALQPLPGFVPQGTAPL